MNLAEQQLIRKLWVILQEIKEKFSLFQEDVDVYIDLPKIPRGIYLKKWLEICGESASEKIVLNERADIINGLCRREVISLEEEMDDIVRITVKRLKFNSFYKKIEKEYRAIPEADKTKVGVIFLPEEIEKRKIIIARDKNGDFFYKNKSIKFEDKDAIYYLIFECLFEQSDLAGFCSYEIINHYLEKHGKEEYTTDRQKIDRIKNGITNLFRFSNLPSEAPDKKKIIQKVKGKGVILYNPPL